MSTYIFPTDNTTAFIVAVGRDEKDAKEHAEQALQALPNTKLMGQQEINHSIVVNLSITLLTKKSSDEILIQKIIEKFGTRAKFEIKNDLHDDGSMRKHFYVNEKDEIHLDLRNKEQVDSYQDTGLNNEHLQIIFDRLEQIVTRSEMVISLTSPNGEKALEAPEITEPVIEETPVE
jgi:hypothetical protein